MSRLFGVFVAVVSIIACIACAHEVPVGEGIEILTMSNMSLAHTGKWLLVLYAPWCPHCRTLLQELPNLAKEIKSKNGGVTIGVVNADAEPAIQMQFSVNGFPSVFYAEDCQVYEFPHNTGRTIDSLTKFALKDYAKETPLSGIKAPFGIAMRMFGLYSAFAIGSYRFLEVYAQKLNIPPMWFFCGVAVALALFVIVLMIVLSRFRGNKKCPAPRKSASKDNDSAVDAAIVQQARAENPIEGAAIANTEKVQEKVKKAKEEQELHRRSSKKDKEAVREQQKEQQKREQKKLKRSSKGADRQQNRPTQQPSKKH